MTAAEMGNKRLQWVDIMKGMLIICVIVGHARTGDVLNKMIFSFHMPLFFIVAGYLLHLPARENWKRWARRKAGRFLIPYTFFFFFCSYFMRKMSPARVLYFFLGNRELEGFWWFIEVMLMSLLAVSLIELYVASEVRRKGIYILCFLAAMELSLLVMQGTLSVKPVPWCLDIVPMAMVYLALGYYGKPFVDRFSHGKMDRERWILLGLSLLVMTALFVGYRWLHIDFKLDMRENFYGRPLTVLAAPMAGGILLMQLSLWLDRVPVVSRLMAYIGRASMVIMYLHTVFRVRIIIPVMGKHYNVALYVMLSLLIGCTAYFLADRWKITRCLLLGLREK